MKYLKVLLNKGKISEIHLWQFVNNKIDLAYIESISNLHKTIMSSADYKEIKPKIIKESFSLSIKSKNEAYILFNDKYEIIIRINNNTESVIIDVKNNERFDTLKQKVLDSSKYIDVNIYI